MKRSRTAALLLAGSFLAAACGVKVVDVSDAKHPNGTTTTSTGGSTTPGGSTTTTPDGKTGPTPDPADWSSCSGGYECAEVSVPLDYDKPDGEQLTIAMLRASEADPDQKIGTLFLNPGGPGGSGIEFARGFPLPGELTERFDIVGFDPRGVGQSSPISCHTHLQDIYDADATMENDAAEQEYLEVSQEFVDECAADAGDVLPYLGTANVARDLDQLRQAVGDEKLNYLGYSYGTSIGQQYARLFPTNVRAMVLDGVVDSSVTGLEAAKTQAMGFDRALDAFVTWCDAQKCVGGDTAKVINDVQAAVEKAPIPAPDADRPATVGVIDVGISGALYSDSLWPDLGYALEDAANGDGSGMVDLADNYLNRDASGEYPNLFEIYFAVSCLDSEWPRNPDDVFAAAKTTGGDFPYLGEALVNDYVRCSLWPVDPEPIEPIPANISGLAPILLVSTTNDPATPHENAVKVAASIPDATLLTYDGEGHTIFGQGNSCVDDAVVEYLVSAKKPAGDINC